MSNNEKPPTRPEDVMPQIIRDVLTRSPFVARLGRALGEASAIWRYSLDSCDPADPAWGKVCELIDEMVHMRDTIKSCNRQ